ncbi:MAG: ATP-dependent DNA helicase RecG [Micrococcales bacterium]|nr:MAG: ATP-dependent DNA helicase RecG [Micrococcales bacterium]
MRQAFEVHTVEDALRHFPRRFQPLDTPTPLGEVVAGENVTLLARVVSCHARPMRRRPGYVVNVDVTDDVHRLPLTFFAAKRSIVQFWERKLMRPGQVLLFEGKADVFNRTLQVTHPRIIEFGEDHDVPPVLPIYPATKGLNTMAIWRIVKTCLGYLDGEDLPDPVPAAVLARHRLPALGEAFRLIHTPTGDGSHQQAIHRFRHEEALAAQLALAQRRLAAKAMPAVARAQRSDGLVDRFDAGLPFELTAGQRRVGREIADDLARSFPMHRLLQGEVGSGKTVVALRAMLAVVDAGGQATLLAPTEVLAAQHLRSMLALLGELGDWTRPDSVHLTLLTGGLGAAARRDALREIENGTAGIIIGTHALLSQTVAFADLGLVVVDEQHRFGVEQRDALRDKASVVPHLLVMTATPIPRTIAMTVFGDLEVSTLREVPAGRAEVSCHVVDAANQAWMDRTWARAAEEIASGRGVFVVCPRIGPDAGQAEEGPELEPPEADRQLQGVLEVADRLAGLPALAGARIGVAHGRQPGEEREAAMRDFAAGDLDVLVATTVVEVGVDVPNASMMIVLDADRFGVSQLHQLRGRVGRGEHRGLCLLVDGSTDTARGQLPVPGPGRVDPGTTAGRRLAAVAANPDGFTLADLDLSLRREGDVLGAAQSGRRSSLRLLRVSRDATIIQAAREDAGRIIDDDPQLRRHPQLRAMVERLLDEQQRDFLDRA